MSSRYGPSIRGLEAALAVLFFLMSFLLVLHGFLSPVP